MADVKIVDIDGSQWSMKDQEARNKITELEEKTTVKVTVKINEVDIKLNLVEINNEKFLQLHCNGLNWSGTIGETIASFNQDFGISTVLRCSVGLDFSDDSGRGSAGLDIGPDGQIKIYPHNSNSMVGFYKASRIYCDAFIKVM